MSTWRRHRAQRNSRASSIVPPGGEGWTIRDYRAILHSEPYASAGSGRSLGRDRQVSAVRGCVGLLPDSDLTPTHERRHRRYARHARPLAGTGGKPRHVPGGRGGPIQRWFAFDRHSQFTRTVRHLSAHFHSHQHPFPSQAGRTVVQACLCPVAGTVQSARPNDRARLSGQLPDLGVPSRRTPTFR